MVRLARAAFVILLIAGASPSTTIAQSLSSRQVANSVRPGGFPVSASHNVRIRIRPHWKFALAGTRIMQGPEAGSYVEYDVVRLYTNAVGVRISTGDGDQQNLSLLQSPFADEVRYADRSVELRDLAASGAAAGEVFLIERPHVRGQQFRYVTVTE